MRPDRATVPELMATQVDAEPAGAARASGGRRGLFRKRRNRRITVAQGSVAVWVADGIRAAAVRLLVAGRALAAVALLAGAAWGGEHAVRHVIASPRFALREVRVAATDHVREEEVLALAGVQPGDRLLAIDTDAVAARVAAHPWVASARVRRELPSALAIDISERRAAAAALLGTFYLLDEEGHPFKRATVEEADGLPVLTGVAREQYTAHRAATEAAFREALELLSAYAAIPNRPALSEVHIDPRYGFSLVLFDGGGEVKLGRGDWDAKLSRLDRILAALGSRGPRALGAVHLDGAQRDRVAVHLVGAPEAAPPALAAKKFRPRAKRGED